MKTKTILQSDPAARRTVLEVLQHGGVVALPTDTVYGIACAVDNPQAIAQMYTIKERDALKAIPVLVGEISQLERIAAEFNATARLLAEHFWPGALTIVVEKNPALPQELTIYPTVGIRMPAYDWLLDLMRANADRWLPLRPTCPARPVRLRRRMFWRSWTAGWNWWWTAGFAPGAFPRAWSIAVANRSKFCARVVFPRNPFNGSLPKIYRNNHGSSYELPGNYRNVQIVVLNIPQGLKAGKRFWKATRRSSRCRPSPNAWAGTSTCALNSRD